LLNEQQVNTKPFSARRKRIVLAVLVVVALLLGTYSLLRFGFGLDLLDRSGFHFENGIVQYLDYFGRPRTGWQCIDGRRFYFSPKDGAMVKGWQEIDGQQYYFGTDGVLTTGWLVIDGQRHYFGENGVLSVGWQEVDGKRCCFSKSGVALTGWQTIGETLYYFDADGYAASGWVELDEVRFRFNEDGSVVTGCYEDGTDKYYFDEDGFPHNGWLEWENEYYYCTADGAVVTGWLTLGQDRYFLHPDGTMAKGQVIIDGVSSFFTSQGKYVLVCNPWHVVPENYVLSLSEIEGYRFADEGVDALEKMLNDCRGAGNPCIINNAYRSEDAQQEIWDRRVATFMAMGMSRSQAEAETSKSVAVPGYSEHHTGLAADLNGGQATYNWLAEHCWDYGFILRYPDDKFQFTGVVYEPWHFRYVGTELSLELKANGLTLEEYMAQLTPSEVPEVHTVGLTVKTED